MRVPPQQRNTTSDDDDAEKEEAPILTASRHLLKANGSISGRDVAQVIEPLFPSFASAIPRDLGSTTALASIDGRRPISHARIHDFSVRYFGPALHRLGFGRGHRIALVLPNGPELALAIVACANWASCVPLSANGAASELEADLLRCGADLVIGPYSQSGDLCDLFGRASYPLVQLELDVDVDVDQRERFCVLDSGTKDSGAQEVQDYRVFASIEESAKKLAIPFVGLVPSPNEAGIFRLVQVLPTTSLASPSPLNLQFDQLDVTVTTGSAANNGGTATALWMDRVDHNIRPMRTGTVDQQSNEARDEVLVLFTSGTTGNKKLVPHQLGDMLTAATTIALSWDLTPDDVNCNLMPLFHVGGIVRQVFSPLISGGCVICCPSFDPSIFWTLMAKGAFTWYYAAPTMHQLILHSHEPVLCPRPRLRMIANAAGGLMPSTAFKLQETFQGANVLPSYGMTECMPISSPPATYQLDKPGTSGVAVGPEIAIINLANMEQLVAHQEGPICVRGEPLFRGYGKLASDPDGKLPETFLNDGWFNTGDLGYLDEEGYLYITGRSKEVINRGGEIISPMEVEEAISSHPAILACAAFSARHDVLQEVVGIVLVMKPNYPRLDLMGLHAFLGDKLAAPKWPQCLVFLDGLPKSHTNKLLRVKLDTRFGLPQLCDDMSPIQRTFEGKCPPHGTSLDERIPVHPVVVSPEESEQKLKAALIEPGNGAKAVSIVANSKRVGSFVCYLYNIDCTDAIEAARKNLDGYAVPTHFIQIGQTLCAGTAVLREPTVNDALDTILQSSSLSGPIDPLVASVQEIFIQLLKIEYMPKTDTNFFQLGGSSLLASQLASKIRKEFGVNCSGAEIFHHSTSDDLAKLIRKRRPATDETISTASESQDDSSGNGDKSFTDYGAPFDSKHIPPQCSFWAMVFQLVPMFVVYPMWQVTRYLLFFAVLLRSLDLVPTDRNLGTFVIAYAAFHICWITVTPLVFVAIKWVVIGRYQSGRFPIWGSYYLRWWFVDICRQLFLRGIWGSNQVLLNFYYRLLGAKIGKGARISLEADVAEFDLVTVGENAAIEMCTVRGFGVDNGAMTLGTVKVGHSASVGVRSVVAPYTSIPDNSHLGPATSSYDMKSLDDKFARVNRRFFPEPSLPMQVFVAGPIAFLVNCVGQIPPLLVLLWMLTYKDDMNGAFETPSDLMQWLCDPRRYPFYIGIRIARALVSPFFYMGAALAVKKLVIGKFEPGRRNTRSQWQLLRHHLAATLFSRSKIQNVVDIIGRHYELVSCLYRCLGATVGKRVFWPGHQPVFSGEFDLLEIGDDVVFGSRSFIFNTTVESSEKVILCAGSNVSDNCVVLPGSVVGKSATLGSNSVCPEGWYLPEGSVWFGSNGKPVCLEKGQESKVVINPGMVASSDIPMTELQLIGDASTIRPFGKAFYERRANYFVWPLSWIVSGSVCIKIFIATFHSLPLLMSLQCAAAMLYAVRIQDRDYEGLQYRFVTIYFAVLLAYFWINILRVLVWLGIELCAKWTLMGRRQVGIYNYDTSSYAQRWELYQLICKIRKFSRFNFLQFFYGTPYMAYYFILNGGNVGKGTCLYPAGADPFMPEPDLVVIGDRCVIDCASLVCHLNTRGNFELMQIVMESDCTLRGRSRIQQGVYMESGSQLLEKSIVMTGEVVEADSVWVGCPASWWFLYPADSDDSVPYSADDIIVGDNLDETSKLLKGKYSSSYCV